MNPNIYQTLNTERRKYFGKFISSLQGKKAIWDSFPESTMNRAPFKAAKYSGIHKYAFPLEGRSFQVSLLVLQSTATEIPHSFKHCT